MSDSVLRVSPPHAAAYGTAGAGRSLGHMALMMTGLAVCALFLAELLPPLPVAVLVFCVVVALALWNVRGALSRMMIIIYSAPFSATIGHLFDDRYAWWHTPAAKPLILPA